MAKQIQNSVKLGVFVLAGLLFLILMLFMIGRNKNLFGSNFELKARFENLEGLREGSNVRYLGIQVGTVRKVDIISDTSIEVTMVIEERMKPYIKKNAIASIGTDGLMGNKLINISPATTAERPVQEGDVLASYEAIDMNEMLRVLYKTNDNASLISEELKISIQRLNSSAAFWRLMNEKSLPGNLSTAVKNIRMATETVNRTVNTFDELISNVKNGKGSLGLLLSDTSLAADLSMAVKRMNEIADTAHSLANQLNQTAKTIDSGINYGKGPLNAILQDSQMVVTLKLSLENIYQGTVSFNENMEAMKHHFLFRGYFKKLEKEEKKKAEKSSASPPANSKD